jgi:hypothetical protein
VHTLRHEVAYFIADLRISLPYRRQFLTPTCITGNGNV